MTIPGMRVSMISRGMGHYLLCGRLYVQNNYRLKVSLESGYRFRWDCRHFAGVLIPTQGREGACRPIAMILRIRPS